MDPALVGLAALAIIGALPRLFFRRGRLNAAWWLTAAPFLLAAATLLAGLARRATPLLAPEASLAQVLGASAVPLAIAGALLIGFALGSHRVPVSLWHQLDDQPVELVTWGAYARVRHPFYAAFLLILLSCLVAFPHPGTLAALAAGALQLGRTARREERRLLAGFGDEYARYLSRTGRFWPRRRFFR